MKLSWILFVAGLVVLTPAKTQHTPKYMYFRNSLVIGQLTETFEAENFVNCSQRLVVGLHFLSFSNVPF